MDPKKNRIDQNKNSSTVNFFSFHKNYSLLLFYNTTQLTNLTKLYPHLVPRARRYLGQKNYGSKNQQLAHVSHTKISNVVLNKLKSNKKYDDFFLFMSF